VDRADGTLLVGPPLDGHRHAAEPDRADLDISDTAKLHVHTLARVGRAIQQKKLLRLSA
jgi:hypothetical protein